MPLSPHTENQHTEKVDADSGHTENRRQIKKDELNTDKLNIDRVSKDKNKKEIDNILMAIGNADLIELYWEYIDIRKGMGAPLTPRGLKMLIARSERLSKNNIKVQKLLLENAIINGWKNVFLPTESELKAVNNEIADDLRELLGL
jgi:hypothetical protein